MIKVENVASWGFEHAVRGMRNPKNTWAKSDSEQENGVFVLGDEDAQLAHRLYMGGSDHRKFLRQIFVSMDITAPLYWWKEFDQYKVGVVTDSCSTMHTIQDKEFTADDFSVEHVGEGIRTRVYNECFDTILAALNEARLCYADSGYREKEWWWQMIQLLPASYNQKRTVTFNYENAVNMIRQRSAHKLDEWREFTYELRQLPYISEIIGGSDTYGVAD